MTLRTDVLVVGGGPAGSTAAFQLANAGIDVLLVDRASFPREKTCGESLSPGALARLREIGMWSPQTDSDESRRTVAAPMSVRGMRIRSPRGTTFLGRYRGGPNGSGLVVRRKVLDHELLASARARGAQVLLETEAIDGEVTASGGAIVQVRARGNATTSRIEANRVIIADGRRSFLARKLGFLESGEANPSDRRYAIRAHCENVSGLSDLAEMQVGEGGYCGIAPLSATAANICYVLFTSRLEMTPKTIDSDFRRDLSRFTDVPRRLEGSSRIGEISVVGPLRLVSRSHFTGPFIACGDTTGFLDPFTGEGIAHAIASGVRGAEAIRRSLAGRAGPFAEYQREVQALRRIKSFAAMLLYGLVSRPTLANAAAVVFASVPSLGDAAVRLFGDQV